MRRRELRGSLTRLKLLAALHSNTVIHAWWIISKYERPAASATGGTTYGTVN